MKTKYLYFLIILFILATNACKKDNTPITDTPPAGSYQIGLGGSVIAQDGLFVAGAQVTFNGQVRTTDQRGIFYFESVTAVHGSNYVEVTKPGFFYNGRIFLVLESGDQSVKIRLIPRVLTGSFSGAAGGTVTTSDGMAVAIPANAIAGGYQGQVNVFSRYIDATALESAMDFPGLIGRNAEGDEGLLVSYGMGHIELEDAEGNELQLAVGAQAQLKMPVPAQNLANAPTTIPLWYFDQNQGIWIEEGTASLQGNEYMGNVSHFTTWNCDDLPACRGLIRLKIKCGETPYMNLPVIIKVEDQSFSVTITEVTNSEGIVSFPVFCNGQSTIYAVPPGEQQITYLIGTVNGPGEGGFVLSDTLNGLCGPHASVSGTAVDGQGLPVTNGYAYLVFDDFYTEPVFFDESGAFLTSYFAFDPDLLDTEADIKAWNLDNFTTATGPSVPFNEQLNVLSSPIIIGGSSVEIEGRVFVSGITDYLFYCLDAATGDIIWSLDLGPLNQNISPVYRDNLIYVRNLSGDFYCINAFDGSIIWDTYISGSNAPFTENGVIYLSSLSGTIRAINAINGDLLWNYNAGSGIFSAPTVVGDILYCGKGSAAPGLVALNKNNGTLLWAYGTPDQVNSSPCVADNKVFFGCDDQELYCLNATTGQFLWKATIDNSIELSSSPTTGNGFVYVQSVNHIRAFNMNTGSEVWEKTITSSPGGDSPYFIGNQLFVSSSGPNPLYCFDALTGSTLFEINEDGTGAGADYFVVVDNVIIMRRHESPFTIEARNASNGQLIWVSEAANNCASPMVVVDGKGIAHYTSASGMKQ